MVSQEIVEVLKNIMDIFLKYSKTCVKRQLPRPKIGFQDQLSLNAGQKYCRILQWEYSAILSTFIKLPFVIKIFALSIFKCPLYTGFKTLKAKCIKRSAEITNYVLTFCIQQNMIKC